MKYLVLARGRLDDLPVKLCEIKAQAICVARNIDKAEVTRVANLLVLGGHSKVLRFSIVEFDDNGKPVRNIAVKGNLCPT